MLCIMFFKSLVGFDRVYTLTHRTKSVHFTTGYLTLFERTRILGDIMSILISFQGMIACQMTVTTVNSNFSTQATKTEGWFLKSSMANELF